MNIQPVSDHLLVEPVTEADRTASGIILPDTAKEKPQTGKVIAVGTDEELRKHFREGQTVLFTRYGGSTFTWQGQELLILSTGDVLAILGD